MPMYGKSFLKGDIMCMNNTDKNQTKAIMPVIMKGAPAAERLTEELKARSEKLRAGSIVPTLAILRVGNDPSDMAYERGALKRSDKALVEIRNIVLPENASEQDILAEIEKINADDSIHGCLMFRPLKNKETEKKAAEMLDPKKDVDCMTLSSQAAVYTGNRECGFAPCTAEAVIELLKYYNIEISGKNAVVLGRSQVIGKPAAMLLLEENATVTVCHSKTGKLKEICKKADIIVAAMGRSEMIDEDYLSADQTIIDVGINVGADGKMCGDVKESAKEAFAAKYTPVPGGVGSMTSTILMKHVIEAAERTVV